MIQLNDKGDAFDLAWAFHYWLGYNYDGICCDKYEALCTLEHDLKLTNVPSIDVDDNDCDEYENTVMMYNELGEDNWKENWDNFCNYMENEWQNED